LKSRTRYGILLLVLLASIFIIHDLWPYSEFEYETQQGTFTSNVSFDLDNYDLNIITVNLFTMIIEPDYQITGKYLLNSTFDKVIVHLLLTNGSYIYLYDEFSDLFIASFYNDTSYSFYNLSSVGPTLKIYVAKPPKFLISQFLVQIVLVPDIKLTLTVAVVLMALVIYYLSKKMMKY
jgi:hypothetical protein